MDIKLWLAILGLIGFAVTATAAPKVVDVGQIDSGSWDAPEWSQPPVPGKGSEKGSEPQTKTNDAQTEPASDQRGTPQSPVAVQILTPVEVNIHAEKVEENQFKKALNDWGISIFTGISTAIFLAQLVVFGRQASRLKETVAAMKATRRESMIVLYSKATYTDTFERAITRLTEVCYGIFFDGFQTDSNRVQSIKYGGGTFGPQNTAA